MRSLLRNRTVLSILYLATAYVASGQVDTGTISGTVKDSSGAVVQDAGVKIEDSATHQTISVRSSSAGFFSAPSLKPGIYQVSASAVGFQTVVKTGIEVRVQDRIAVDFDLQPGQVSTEVTVAANVAALDSGTSSLGQVVEETEIKNLPLERPQLHSACHLGRGDFALAANDRAEHVRLQRRAAHPEQLSARRHR